MYFVKSYFKPALLYLSCSGVHWINMTTGETHQWTLPFLSPSTNESFWLYGDIITSEFSHEFFIKDMLFTHLSDYLTRRKTISRILNHDLIQVIQPGGLTLKLVEEISTQVPEWPFEIIDKNLGGIYKWVLAWEHSDWPEDMYELHETHLSEIYEVRVGTKSYGYALIKTLETSKWLATLQLPTVVKCILDENTGRYVPVQT